MTQSPDEAALIRSIVADPDSDLPRLVYADWLDDHGRTNRARLIRVQCEIERLRAEEGTLIERAGGEWGADLHAAGAHRWAFHRGFPEEVTVSFQDYVAHHDRLNATTPVCRLHLTDYLSADMDADLAVLARLPAARQLRELDLTHRPHRPTDPAYGPAGVRALAASPHLAGLRRLTLHSPRVGPEGAAVIAGSPTFSNLTHLTVTDPACGQDNASLLGLVQSPHLPNLESVQLGDLPPLTLSSFRSRVRDGSGGPPGRGAGR